MLNSPSNPPAYRQRFQTADQLREARSRFPIAVDPLKTVDERLPTLIDAGLLECFQHVLDRILHPKVIRP